MAGPSFTATEFSPNRDTVKAAVAMVAAAGLFGLWNGLVRELRADRNAEPEPYRGEMTSLRSGSAVPIVSAATDTLIPPGADQPLPPLPAAAPAAKPRPAQTAADNETLPVALTPVPEAPPLSAQPSALSPVIENPPAEEFPDEPPPPDESYD